MFDLNAPLHYQWTETPPDGREYDPRRSFSRSLIRAQQLHWRAREQGWLAQLWAKLTGRSNGLLSLAAIAPKTAGHDGHYDGLRTIAIQQIKGSENRCLDFDAKWRPLQNHTRERWQSIAMVMLEGKSLPPVTLIQMGDCYFVRDGHHRISVAHCLGQDAIDAEVIVCKETNRPASRTMKNRLPANPALTLQR